MPIDSALGRLGIKQGVCTSSTRPTNPFEGQVIYESDTNRTLVYDNAAWVVVADNQVLSIDSTNGRVGIGTDTPEANLDINGNTPSLLFTSPTDTNRYRIDANISDAADFGLSLGYWDGAAYQRTLTVDDTGKVGINDTAPSYPLDVTGDINTTGNLRIGGTAIGEWTAFTPTLANCTTTSIDAVYSKINKVVHVNCRLNIASVTGTVLITLPTTPSKIVIGLGEMSDASAASSYAGAVLQWSATQVFLRPFQTSGTYATWNANQNATAPFTWASGDVIRLVLTYVEA